MPSDHPFSGSCTSLAIETPLHFRARFLRFFAFYLRYRQKSILSIKLVIVEKAASNKAAKMSGEGEDGMLVQWKRVRTIWLAALSAGVIGASAAKAQPAD